MKMSRLIIRYVIWIVLIYIFTWAIAKDLTFALRVAFFVGVLLTAEFFTISIPGEHFAASTAHIICAAVAIIFPPAWAAWINSLGSMDRDEIDGKVSWVPFFYNRFQHAVTSWIVSTLFHRLSTANIEDYKSVFAAAIAASLYFICNALFVSLYIGIVHKNPIKKTVFYFLRVAPAVFGVIPLSYIMVLAEEAIGFLGALAFLAPVISSRYVLQHSLEIRNHLIRTIRSLMAALEAKDEGTFGHSDRVSKLAMEVGRELGLSETYLEKIQVAAILHDIGKIGIPDSVLKKPGKYTEEEYLQMAKHTIIGQKIISTAAAMNDIATWVRWHHERYDGLGWPDAIKGEEIPLPARIISVCDAFDAMTSLRPYRTRLVAEDAIEELKRNAGTQFDPIVVDALARVVQDKARLERIMRSDEGLNRILVDFDSRERENVVKSFRARLAAAVEMEVASGRDRSEAPNDVVM